MCWRYSRGRFRLALAGLTVGAALCGCATPRGALFDPLDPPLVWPGAPETPRVKWVGAISGSGDLQAGQSGGEAFQAALRGPRGPINFSSPRALAVSDGTLLAVADGGAACVHLLDLKKRTHVMVSGWEDGQFHTPTGACWMGERLFVADAARHEVIELDAHGLFHRRFGDAELARPVGIAYVPSRHQLYVVDGGAHDVAVFEPEGTLVKRIGRPGTAPGEFNHPTHICTDGGARLLVADSGNFRVQLLDLEGNSLGTIGRKGNGAGDLALPKGVAFDGDGHIFVVDARFENVQIFDSAGRLLLAFGEEGSGRGQFALPAGVTIDHNNRIWVADSANRRIQVFDYLRVSG